MIFHIRRIILWFVWRSDANENLLPLMMFARNVSVSRKRSVEHSKLAHIANVEPTPSGNAATTLSADLPRKQPRDPFLNAVVVWFDDPFFVLIDESNQTLILDCAVKPLMQSDI